jgi:hypothetical protein
MSLIEPIPPEQPEIVSKPLHNELQSIWAEAQGSDPNHETMARRAALKEPL